MTHTPPTGAQAPSRPAAPGPGRFAPEELEAVLARYDLGRIDSIREFVRGSPLAPKAVVSGPYGRFLVKRRAPGEDHPYQVAFGHGLQLHVRDRGVPAPALVGTRDDNNSMLQLDGRIYEVTEFIEGEPFDRSPHAAQEAGAMLAQFHAGASGFHCTWHTPPDFVHGDERAEILLDRCFDRITAEPTDTMGPEASALVDAVRALWRRAVGALDQAGIAAWPRDLLHADWHPGNVVFRAGRVRAVLDYDSCRRGPRLIDLASGAMNFSIRGSAPGEGGASEPNRWPPEPDGDRARAFLEGYQSLGEAPLTGAEAAAMAPAMAGAIIIEAIGPIATTGRFAGLPGAAFLAMIRRKASWLLDNAGQVGALVAR